MRVLVACEFSGVVRDAFAARGHDAWSCDLLPTERPGLHYQGDVAHILDGWVPVQFAAECDPGECKCLGPTQDDVEYREINNTLFARPIDSPHWDLIIAHPPCTYLTVSAEWAYGDGPYHQNVKPETLVGEARRQARRDAVAFVRMIADASCPRIAIENPIGALSSQWRKPDQIIQPWQFGHDASKSTCLWLKGLPHLAPSDVLPGGRAARRANQTKNGQNSLSPSPNRWMLRSVTYQGIADAMAAQWGQP